LAVAASAVSAAAADSEEAALDGAGRGDVAAAADRLARGYVDELRTALGSRLRAALLFGSAARGEWIEGVSDVNVLVLLDELHPPLLAVAATPSRNALEHGVMPLLMELDEWHRAADVFTLELADMKEAGVTLHGDDPVAAAALQPTHMRLQAERELRGKLLHLHAGMMLAADEPTRLGDLLAHALPSFITYMRAVLRLAGRPVPLRSADVIEQACALTGAGANAFLDVLAARQSRTPLDTTLDTGSVADGYNAAATILANYIDNLGR
jgi:predicted nucleotidyltransferase